MRMLRWPKSTHRSVLPPCRLQQGNPQHANGCRGKATSKSNRPTEDAEPQVTLHRLQSQSQELQGRITQILAGEQATQASDPLSWGSFIGNLTSKIDDRLLPSYYRESLDHTLSYVERSREMQRPLVPAHAHIVQQQHQPQPNFPTFTTLLTQDEQRQLPSQQALASASQ